MASSPPLIIVRIYNVQTCFEYIYLLDNLEQNDS